MLQLIAGNIYRYVTKCEENKIHGNYSTLTFQSLQCYKLEPVLSLIVIFSQVDDSLHHDDYYKFVVVLKTLIYSMYTMLLISF
jgi:hypothetical protein